MPAKQEFFTAAQAAASIGRSDRAVKRAAARIGIGARHGRDWLFSRDDLPKLKAATHDGPGQPRKTKPRKAPRKVAKS